MSATPNDGPSKVEILAGRRVDKIAGPYSDSSDVRDARLVAACRKRWPDFAFTVTRQGNRQRVDAKWTSGGKKLTGDPENRLRQIEEAVRQ